MYFWYIWQNYSTGIAKKELTNVEKQKQTASFVTFIFSGVEWKKINEEKEQEKAKKNLRLTKFIFWHSLLNLPNDVLKAILVDDRIYILSTNTLMLIQDRHVTKIGYIGRFKMYD